MKNIAEKLERWISNAVWKCCSDKKLSDVKDYPHSLRSFMPKQKHG